MPLAPDNGTAARPEASLTIKQGASHHVNSPAPAASDAAISHISETPLKSKKSYDDFECTSRPGVLWPLTPAYFSTILEQRITLICGALTGGGRDNFTSPPSRAAAPLDRQMASPVMARADMQRHLTPKRTPSKKVVKRHRKHEFGSGVLPSVYCSTCHVITCPPHAL